MSKACDQANQAHMEKEALHGKFAEVRQTMAMRGLRSYVKAVEAFIQSKFPRQREPQLLLVLPVNLERVEM